MTPNKLVYIRWFDSAIYNKCAAGEEISLCENISAGLLIEEDDKTVKIALDHCLDTDVNRLILCIPKVNIREIRHINISSGLNSDNKTKSLPVRCHAQKDGDCDWTYCPQLKDNEPYTSGRHCPLDTFDWEKEIF